MREVTGGEAGGFPTPPGTPTPRGSIARVAATAAAHVPFAYCGALRWVPSSQGTGWGSAIGNDGKAHPAVTRGAGFVRIGPRRASPAWGRDGDRDGDRQPLPKIRRTPALQGPQDGL